MRGHQDLQPLQNRPALAHMHPAAAHAGKQCPRQLQRPVAAAGLQRARDERGCRAVVGLQRAGGLAQLGVKEQRLTGGERVAQRVLRLLRRGAQAVYPGVGAADADGGMHIRLLQLHAQLPGPGGGPGHELRGLPFERQSRLRQPPHILFKSPSGHIGWSSIHQHTSKRFRRRRYTSGSVHDRSH